MSRTSSGLASSGFERNPVGHHGWVIALNGSARLGEGGSSGIGLFVVHWVFLALSAVTHGPAMFTCFLAMFTCNTGRASLRTRANVLIATR